MRIVPAGDARFLFLGDVIPESIGPEGDEPFSPERLADVAAGGDESLYAFLDTLAGRFAVILVEEERARVFHDPMGARTILYSTRRPLAVASHAMLLGDCLGAAPDEDIRRHRAEPGFGDRSTRSLPGDRTIFEGIRALMPNNLLDSRTMDMHRYWPRAARAESSLATFEQRLDISLGSLARYVSGRYQPVFGATGGADSRLAMTGFRAFGVPFETVTWGLPALKPREQEIIGALVARTDAPHTNLVTVVDKTPLDGIAYRNSGGYRRPYSSTRDMLAVFGARRDAVFLKGHGAEIIRGFYNIRSRGLSTLEPAGIAGLYFAAGRGRAPAETVAMFKGYHRRVGYEGLDSLGFDPNDIHYWEHRMGTWSAGVANELDVAIRSIPTFNSRPLFAAALGLPPRERLTKRLFLRQTARLDPALGDLPIDKMSAARYLDSEAAGRQSRRSPPRGALSALRKKVARYARKIARMLDA